MRKCAAAAALSASFATRVSIIPIPPNAKTASTMNTNSHASICSRTLNTAYMTASMNWYRVFDKIQSVRVMAWWIAS